MPFFRKYIKCVFNIFFFIPSPNSTNKCNLFNCNKGTLYEVPKELYMYSFKGVSSVTKPK